MSAKRGVSSLLCVFCILALSACVGTRLPGPVRGQADFGDAPDGGPTGYPAGFPQIGAFPTTAAKDGARSRSGNGARLGRDITLEVAPKLTNNDEDDGITGLTIQLVSIPPPARLATTVSVPAGGRGGTYWLNVLIDLNMNGQWDGIGQPGTSEWAVQNFPVTVAAGTVEPVTPPAFAFGSGNRLPDPAWMRIAVTSTPVPADWTGTGNFAAGEIEDHLVRLPAKRSAIPRIECPPGSFRFGPNEIIIRFICTITNIGPPGDVTYEFTRQTGNVVVAGPGAVRPPLRMVNRGLGRPDLVQGTIPAMARGETVQFEMSATRGLPNDTPSRWRARVAGLDPPSVVDAKGVSIGYEDSLFDFDFQAQPVEEFEPRPD